MESFGGSSRRILSEEIGSLGGIEIRKRRRIDSRDVAPSASPSNTQTRCTRACELLIVLYSFYASRRVAAVPGIIQFFPVQKGDRSPDGIACCLARARDCSRRGSHIEAGKFARTIIGQSTCEISSLIAAQVISPRRRPPPKEKRLIRTTHKLLSKIETIDVRG